MERCYWGISSAGDRLPQAIYAEYIVRLCFADGNRRLTQNTKTPPVWQPYTIMVSCAVPFVEPPTLTLTLTSNSRDRKARQKNSLTPSNGG